MFSRQLALLLECGTDIVTSLDLLQNQITNRTLQKIIGEIASDIRGGSSLSTALSKHPQAFSPMYHRAIAAGEQGGNLEVVLRQMADYMERGAVTQKRDKRCLDLPHFRGYCRYWCGIDIGHQSFSHLYRLLLSTRG